MEEQFLHYIWQYQKFNKSQLRTTSGLPIVVFNPGHHNHDSGPDFEEAKLKIGELDWFGHVEIHVRSVDWIRHQHHLDSAYNGVILHGVWEHNKETLQANEPLQTLELKDLVDPEMVSRYTEYISNNQEVLCSNLLSGVSNITFRSMIDRALVERLELKAQRILEQLEQNKNDWESVTYQTVVRNFGFSTNSIAFERLSELLPYQKLKRVLNNPRQTEALIFGQAGFLRNSTDDYGRNLKQEFDYLHQKFELAEPMQPHEWKFGKLRPANLPYTRLSQLSSLLLASPQLFTELIQIDKKSELMKLLRTELNSYWQHHYDFNKVRIYPVKSLGSYSSLTLITNIVAPLLAAYSKYTDNQSFMDRAIALLESLPSESNRIIKKWIKLDIKPESAFESQGLLQLFNCYCTHRKCLQCNIGVDILNK